MQLVDVVQAVVANDAWMAKVAKRTKLGLCVVTRAVSVEDFERDLTPKLGVFGLVHCSGASPPSATGEGEASQPHRFWGPAHEP